MNKQLTQHRARERFARAVGLLHVEIAIGTERRHLDNLVELCKAYLEQLDGTLEHAALDTELDDAIALIPTRPAPPRWSEHPRRMLRAIKGGRS